LGAGRGGGQAQASCGRQALGVICAAAGGMRPRAGRDGLRARILAGGIWPAARRLPAIGPPFPTPASSGHENRSGGHGNMAGATLACGVPASAPVAQNPRLSPVRPAASRPAQTPRRPWPTRQGSPQGARGAHGSGEPKPAPFLAGFRHGSQNGHNGLNCPRVALLAMNGPVVAQPREAGASARKAQL